MVRILLAAVIVAAVVVWFLIGFLAERSVRQAISRDATDKALHWADYMSSHIPDLPVLLDTGRPTEEQKQTIRRIRQLGDIFRFRLFDDQGRLVLISDEAFISNPQGIAQDFDPETIEVIQSGAGIVDVFDGTKKPDRPDLYAEAYVPLIDESGAVFGVVEVYVDETLTAEYFLESFESFGIFVSTLSTILFLVPAVGFALQRGCAKRSQNEAEKAKFDALTGLLSRAEFMRRATKLVDQNALSALLFVDADKFKAINDTHGHAVGDKYLEHIGRTLTAITDPRDLVARLGGDEFVVGMSGADRGTVLRRARTIVDQCSEPVDISKRTLASSISMGVSFVGDGADLDGVLAEADAALYYVKSTGRNQFAVYGDELGENVRRRNALETRIRAAAERQEFWIEYQPLVDGNTFEPIGYEALLRLKLEDGTPVPPSEFIPLAEEMGLIEEIGAWTIHEATREIARLSETAKLAINLSAAQFPSQRLSGIVANALSASGLPAERLELEITESLLLEDDPSIAMQLDALQDMGVGIAMDDFGTGFSSLGYLWKYNFDRIKIDRSFVSGLSDNSPRSMEIIETVVMLGKRLGMQVTAEGIETQGQVDALSGLGCDEFQGYFFGRPAGIQEQHSTVEGGPARLGERDRASRASS